ncbi:hypothetical protein CRE_05239 [Caenorhabditis remanei]|uniref:RPAP1 N-terminal domain-containing protein n=1 Tax=Caenorhabditis remanei TaxID=31234 RepID=E3NGT1_CAERE|nr:hypothetical protein CRE_05239 [Caenorhabditis remanei]
MSEILKRPTASETDADLQKMQEEWSQTNKKPSVEIHRMKKRTKIDENAENLAENPPKLAENVRNQAARFQIDLDDTPHVSTVLFPVLERNFDVFDTKIVEKPDFLAENWSKNLEFFQYSKDDGFPEPLDLSAYFQPKSGRGLTTVPPNGVSFFAAEFDRIHGNFAENLDEAEQKGAELNPEEDSGDFHVENEKYLKSLDVDKILEMKLEIQERFDPKIIDFLKNRGNSEKNAEKTTKISKFKASRLKKGAEPIEKGAELMEPKGAEPVTKEVEEMMNELEVLEEWKDQQDQEKYNRLATVRGRGLRGNGRSFKKKWAELRTKTEKSRRFCDGKGRSLIVGGA